MKPKRDSQIRNFQRRNFLKYSLFAIGGFVVGKTLDSIQNLFSSKKGLELIGPSEEKMKIFENFVVKETEKELSFHDRRDGYKVFVIEK